MADQIDNEPLDSSTSNESENASDPTQVTKTFNPKQETENMKTQTLQEPGQRWRHYFYEFFMVFLAVFAGFLAENQRENFGEKQREKKFANRLLSDLRQDSIFFEMRIKLLEKRQNDHKQFLKIMTNPVRATDSAVMRGFVVLLTGTSNDYTTATYNQMKTSGSLRYIGNDDLTTSLQKYYDVLLAKASHDSEGADKFFSDYIISYMTKHFRFQDFNPTNGTLPHTKLLNRSEESDQELINIMGIWATNCDAQLGLQRPAQKQMLELIMLIKKEYHFE